MNKKFKIDICCRFLHMGPINYRHYTIVRFQKLWRFFRKNVTFRMIVGFISKMTYFKNWPISKIGLFQK